MPAGRTVTVTAAVTDPGGAPARDIQPWLGAMGHLLLVSRDGSSFAHAHPDDRVRGVGENGVIPFLVRLSDARGVQGMAAGAAEREGGYGGSGDRGEAAVLITALRRSARARRLGPRADSNVGIRLRHRVGAAAASRASSLRSSG